jgi:O-antigen ligase
MSSSMTRQQTVLPTVACVVLGAFALGALTAVQPLVLVSIPAILFVLVILGRRPLQGFLLIFAARTLSDSSLLPASVSTVVNVAVLAAVVLMLLLRRFGEPVRLGPTALILLLLVTVGTAVGVLRYGLAPSIFSETLRAVGVIAIALLAGRVAREVAAVPFARGILGASVPALLAVVVGGVLQVPYFYSSSTGRAFGTFSHPLGAAGFMTLVALLSLFVLRERPSALARCTLGLAVIGTLFTMSLSGLLATAAALVVYAFVYRVRIRVSWLVGGALLTGLALTLTTTGQLLAARLISLQAPSLAQATSASDTNSLEWRLRNWYRLLLIWRDDPLFGHGWGTTYELIQPLGKTPHSGPIRLLVEVGAVGLAVAVWLAWRAWASAVRQLSAAEGTATRELAGLRLSALTAVVANSLAANTMSYIPMLLLFVTMWMLGDSPSLDDSSGPASSRGAPRVRTPALRS